MMTARLAVCALLVVALAGLGSNMASAFSNNELFQRYSKMKLLTSCLGEETMARWRQQLVAAGKNCERDKPFIPALLHQMPTIFSQPIGHTLFVPSRPYNPPATYQPHHGQHHQQQPSRPQRPTQVRHVLTSVGSQFGGNLHNTFYVTTPQVATRPLQQYYYYYTPLQYTPQQQHYVTRYPQVGSYSQNTPLFVTYQPQATSHRNQSQTGDSNRVGPQHQSKAGFQRYQPQSTSSFSSHMQMTQANSITFNEKLLPGYVAPNIAYLTIQQELQEQQERYEHQQKLQQQKPWEEKSQSGFGINSTRYPTMQQDTYTNPSLKYEDTEHYQDQQKRLESLQERTTAEFVSQSQTPVSSFHQKRPFDHQENQRGLNKRSKRHAVSQVAQAPSSRFPHYHQQVSPEQVRAQQLRAVHTRVSDKISNMTCVMTEMKLLTAELDPDYDFLESSLLELPISTPMYEELKESQSYCRQAALCHPRRSHLHGLAISPQFSAALEFFRCFGKEKLRACLKADVAAMAQMLGAERGPLSGPNIGGAQASVFHGSVYESALEDLEELLNGGSGSFVDLVLL